MNGDGGFAAGRDCLAGGAGDLRVWSLIVTIFGDLARPHDALISGALLSALTARMGIRPEAMRVALHRLRRDGWIESARKGRSSRHRLSPDARAETEAARRRIYGPGMAAGGDWQLAFCESREIPDGMIPLAPGLFLGPAGIAVPKGCLCFRGPLERLPGWLRARLAPAELAEGYRDLAESLARAEAAIAPGLGPLEIAALRVLAVHRWRRLLLRHADLPAAFLPEDWPGTLCRARLHALLDRLPRPTLEVLEAEAA